MEFTGTIGAFFDTNASVLHVTVLLTLNAPNGDTQVLADVHQVILDMDMSREKLIGSLQVKTCDL